MREVPRSTIERCAHILGDASAARMALADADRRHAQGENVAFFLSGGSIFVGPPVASREAESSPLPTEEDGPGTNSNRPDQ